MKKGTVIFIFKSKITTHKERAIRYCITKDRRLYDFVSIIASDALESYRDSLAPLFSRSYYVDLHKSEETKLHRIEFDDLLVISRKEKGMLRDGAQLYIVAVDEITLLDVAKVRDELNLFGHGRDNLEKFRDKYLMLKHASENGISCPRYTTFSLEKYRNNRKDYFYELQSEIGLPLLLKPRSAAGSIGLVKINSLEEFYSATEKMRGDDYIACAYIEGEQYHCESIIQDGEFVFEACSHFRYPPIKFIESGKILCSTPLRMNDVNCNKFTQFNRKVVRTFEIDNISTTCEFFLANAGKLFLVEINARLPGEPQTYVHYKERGCWMDYLDYLVQTDRRVESTLNKQTVCASWAFFPNKRGRLTSFSLPPLKSSHEAVWKFQSSVELCDPESIYDWFLQLILISESKENIELDLQTLEQWNFLEQ